MAILENASEDTRQTCQSRTRTINKNLSIIIEKLDAILGSRASKDAIASDSTSDGILTELENMLTDTDEMTRIILSRVDELNKRLCS